MRLGLFGGTFDPVHYGHLLLAECCLERCRLDRLWFLPALTPPHKLRDELTPADQRAEMLELAIGGHEALSVSRMEIERGGVSFTVDTLDALRAEDAERELFFLMGADSLHDLPTWREPARICRLATLVVTRRSGLPEPDFASLEGIVDAEKIEEIRAHQVEMPRVDLSSTDIRRRVTAGKGIRYRTPRAVEEYIKSHRLYRTSAVS